MLSDAKAAVQQQGMQMVEQGKAAVVDKLAPSSIDMDRGTVSLAGIKMDLPQGVYIINPVPNKSCSDVCALMCASSPVYYEPLGGDTATETLTYSHGKGCCGCPPGRQQQLSPDFFMYEGLGKGNKKLVAKTKKLGCCANGCGFACCPCLYNSGAIKTLSVMDKDGKEKYTLQRELTCGWYFAEGCNMCPGAVACFGAFKNCTELCKGNPFIIKSVPVFGPLEKTSSERVLLGHLQSMEANQPIGCCAAVPVFTASTRFIKAEGVELTPEEIKELSVLTVGGMTGHKVLDCFAGPVRAPIAVPSGNACLDLGLAYKGAGGLPLIQYKNFMDAAKDGSLGVKVPVRQKV